MNYSTTLWLELGDVFSEFPELHPGLLIFNPFGVCMNIISMG